tara:strand:- start:659 stop:844 length:186 start_codon:yes stop_codon:yes gene_type:complete
MKIIIDLRTDNAAFENFDYQLGKILDKVKISIIENHLSERNLFDFNGNKIGNFKINYNESK